MAHWKKAKKRIETIPELRAYARQLFGSSARVSWTVEPGWTSPLLSVDLDSKRTCDFRIEWLPKQAAIAAAVAALRSMKRQGLR